MKKCKVRCYRDSYVVTWGSFFWISAFFPLVPIPHDEGAGVVAKLARGSWGFNPSGGNQERPIL